MFFVELARKPLKYIDSLDWHISERIKQTLKSKLSENPVPSDAKFIGRHEGETVFRIRVGDHRALYKVKHNQNIVLIVKIDKSQGYMTKEMRVSELRLRHLI